MYQGLIRGLFINSSGGIKGESGVYFNILKGESGVYVKILEGCIKGESGVYF